MIVFIQTLKIVQISTFSSYLLPWCLLPKVYQFTYAFSRELPSLGFQFASLETFAISCTPKNYDSLSFSYCYILNYVFLHFLCPKSKENSAFTVKIVVHLDYSIGQSETFLVLGCEVVFFFLFLMTTCYTITSPFFSHKSTCLFMLLYVMST